MTASSGGMSRAPTDGQLRLITKVARMYHERGVRQVDIADTLHISQARVSRLLKRAAELGIVRTVVAVAPGVLTEVEEALEDKYGLAEAVVVDVEGSDHDIIAALGSAGATYLETTLTGGERIGISSWSQTLLAVVDRMRPLRVPGAESVIQLMGGIGSSSVQTQGNRLLTEFARLVGAIATFVPAPALVGNRTMRESLLNDPAMESVAREWAHITMALAGIGSLPPSPLLRASGNAYLAARSYLVRTLADQVRASAADTDPPAWATQRGAVVPRSVIGEVSVWRAAMQVSPEDPAPHRPRTAAESRPDLAAAPRTPSGRRPGTGPAGMGLAAQPAQPQPDRGSVRPNARRPADGDLPSGVDARQLLCSAITTGRPLPDDHAAAAVWWRISRHLTPTVTAQADPDHTVTTAWTSRLTELVGADRADTLQSSRWWPPLVTAVDHALQRGWRLDDLLGAAGMPDAGSVDAAQALVWRTSLLADPISTDEPGEPLSSAAPRDLRPNTEPPSVETGFGARDDITTRPAGTADAVLAARRIGTGWSRIWRSQPWSVASPGLRSRATRTSTACSRGRWHGRNVRSAATG